MRRLWFGLTRSEFRDLIETDRFQGVRVSASSCRVYPNAASGLGNIDGGSGSFASVGMGMMARESARWDLCRSCWWLTPVGPG